MAYQPKVTATEAWSESVQAKIYGSTVRKRAVLKIRVKAGASHTSWKGGKQATKSARKVMYWLTHGTGYSAMPRPAFDDYINQNYARIKRIIATEVEHGHGTIPERFEKAGEHIKKDLVGWIYAGGLEQYPNFGRYASQKAARFGTPPGTATGALWHSLEVAFE